MSNDKLNLHQRLVRVMASMGAIGKGGQATYGDGYAYHKIDDIDDKLRVALIEHGVLAVIVDIADNKLDFYQDPPDRYGKVKTTWHGECKIVVEFINVDNPKDKLQVVGWGQGVDTSDKATGKALSYASKSVYLQALHLRGQPDNEADNIPRGVSKSEPVEASVKDTVLITDTMQSWIDAINQCDSLRDLGGLGVGLKDESADVQNAVRPHYVLKMKALKS